MKIILILLLIVISPVLSAQNDTNIIVDEINTSPQDSNMVYNLEFKFTGEVTSQLDSAFIIYCVIDKQFLINKNELIIKTYKHIDSTETNIIRKNIIDIERDHLSTEDNGIKIEIGKASQDISYINVFLIDVQGTEYPVTFKHK